MPGVAVRWSTHPVTLVAALVLLLNDHLLQPSFRGPVTGKISDAAGLVVAPALLALAVAVVTPRLPAGTVAALAIAATGVGFALAKLTVSGATVASAAWSAVAGPSYILADPTDLLALPALAFAWWSWRRSVRARRGVDATRLRVVVGLPVAMFAVAASSAPAAPYAVTVVEENAGQVVVAGEELDPYRSSSGTGGWTPLADTPSTAALLHGLTEHGRANDFDAYRQSRACVPGNARHCYRIHGVPMVDGQPGNDLRRDGADGGTPSGDGLLRVDETHDGGRTWHVAWQVPAARWGFLADEHFLYRTRDTGLLASVDILVRRVPGGHQVVVADGVDGLLVRDPDGSWRRVGVTLPDLDRASVRIEPAPLGRFGALIGAEIGLAVALGGVALLLCALVARWRTKQLRGAPAPLAPLIGMATAVAWSSVIALTGLGLLELSARPAGVFALVALAAATGVALLQRGVPRRYAVLLVLAAALVAAMFAAPYLGWTLGVPASHHTATTAAFLAAMLGLATALAAAWRIGAVLPPRRAPAHKEQSTRQAAGGQQGSGTTG